MPNIIRSILAVIAGMIAVVVLSEGTDAALRLTGILPPLADKASYTTMMFMAATVYRTLAGIIGGYVTAALAPPPAMTHVIVLGVIGLALSLAGVYVNMTQHLGPEWYPIALAVTAFPSVWFGGRLRLGNSKVAQP